MTRGRPPKSPKLRRLEGNPGKRAIPELLIVPEGAPFAPEHLSDDAIGCLELSPLLQAMMR